MSNPSLVIVLVEDEHHRMLIYRYLKRSGLKSSDIRIRPYPAGRGSAEGWVLQRFPEETAEYRNRQARAGTGLIVMIDADTHAVDDRLTQLDEALRNNGEEPVRKGERIARLVPKRNVETWILCLNEEPVDEEADYTRTRREWNKLIPQAAVTLYQWARPHAVPPNHCVDSLRTGVQELKRLP